MRKWFERKIAFPILLSIKPRIDASIASIEASIIWDAKDDFDRMHSHRAIRLAQSDANAPVLSRRS